MAMMPPEILRKTARAINYPGHSYHDGSPKKFIIHPHGSLKKTA